jgi:hypothetical protein
MNRIVDGLIAIMAKMANVHTDANKRHEELFRRRLLFLGASCAQGMPAGAGLRLCRPGS